MRHVNYHKTKTLPAGDGTITTQIASALDPGLLVSCSIAVYEAAGNISFRGDYFGIQLLVTESSSDVTGVIDTRATHAIPFSFWSGATTASFQGFASGGDDYTVFFGTCQIGSVKARINSGDGLSVQVSLRNSGTYTIHVWYCIAYDN